MLLGNELYLPSLTSNMSSNFSSRAPWKRSACDRCRAQKLRCDRDEGQSADTCLRCLKSQADCIISSARPNGRPSLQHQASINRIENSALGTSIPFDSGPSMNMIGLDYDTSLDAFIESIGMQHSDLYMNEHLVDNPVSPRSTRHSFPLSSVPPEDQVEPSSPRQSYQVNESADYRTPMRVDNTGFLLSEIYCELSKQLLSVKTAPWDVTLALQLTFAHKTDVEETEPSQPHPLLDVSKTSAKFQKLLACLRPLGATEHIVSLSS
ncbi:hypothetical protein F4677DRAFT_423203 [Hypoxylon crocopeplum]|nr:hypothetical protein F4677DRAFT_423203 [Hypoxylon crocopeplum]